jgi:hypothetical protein
MDTDEIKEPMQTIRDPADGELKTSIPNPFEIKQEEEQKVEEQNAEIK